MDEFTVKVASKPAGTKNCLYKLHKDDKITWTEAKMRRENEYQPWQIKLGSGKTSRRFKAIKEGGAGENTSYFVFYQPDNSSDTYEVCPIDEWYSVSATQRYKTLTAEEAEQKFEQRHKTLNLFSVMKKGGEAGEDSSVHDSKGFKVSELDEWDQSGDDFDSDQDMDGEDGETKKKTQKKKSIKKEKDDPDEAPEEGKEDSDEGDFEQREVDYMSDSSSESSDEGADKKDENNVIGIAEEEALRDLLSTDDEEEAEVDSSSKTNKFPMDKDSLGTVDIKQDPDPEGSDGSSDSDDYDVDEDKMDTLFMKKALPAHLVKQEQGKQDTMDSATSPSNISSSQARSTNGTMASANSNKRKATDNSPSSSQSHSTSSQPAPKRPNLGDTSSSALGSQEKMIEDLVKKYLRRKPTPIKTLLRDVKSKLRRMEAAISDEDLLPTLASILKRLEPERRKINNDTYFSLG